MKKGQKVRILRTNQVATIVEVELIRKGGKVHRYCHLKTDGYIASEAGWIVAELGRQPWTIQDMLPTWVGVSGVDSGSVMLTFFIFLVLFTVLLAVEINIMLKQIKKGPEE